MYLFRLRVPHVGDVGWISDETVDRKHVGLSTHTQLNWTIYVIRVVVESTHQATRSVPALSVDHPDYLGDRGDALDDTGDVHFLVISHDPAPLQASDLHLLWPNCKQPDKQMHSLII